MADTKKMSKEEATKRYNISIKRLRKRPVLPSTQKKIMGLFSGAKKRTEQPSPGNVAERFDKALKGVPLTAQQRTSLYNAANTVYKISLKDAEKGISRVEKKIKEGTIEPSVKAKRIKKEKLIPRTRARIASLKVQDPEVGQEGPYKDKTDAFYDEGKAIGESAQYERKQRKQNKAHGGKVYANGSRKPKTR